MGFAFINEQKGARMGLSLTFLFFFTGSFGIRTATSALDDILGGTACLTARGWAGRVVTAVAPDEASNSNCLEVALVERRASASARSLSISNSESSAIFNVHKLLKRREEKKSRLFAEKKVPKDISKKDVGPDKYRITWVGR
jgi:hypothetical protein